MAAQHLFISGKFPFNEEAKNNQPEIIIIGEKHD